MWHSWYAEAVAPRWAMYRGLRMAGPAVVAGLIVVDVCLGLLPLGFLVAMSKLIGRVPALLADGGRGAAWTSLLTAFAVASAAFLCLQALTPVQTALGELARRRIDGFWRDRLMELALHPVGIGTLEDGVTLDALADARRRLESNNHTIGSACTGLLALGSRYLTLVTYVVVIGVVLSWWLSLLLGATVMIFRYGQISGHRRYSRVWRRISSQVRRTEYLRELGIGGGAAKDIRVFGIIDWLGHRYEDLLRGWLREIWTARRRVYLYPFLYYTGFGLLSTGLVGYATAEAGVAGSVPLTSLVLCLQVTVAALMLGDHYPEVDLHVIAGSRVLAATARFEAVTTGRPAPGDLLDAAPAARHRPERAPDGAVTVSFVGVAFGYPNTSRPVLDDLDLTIRAGRCTALVGVNGAGKTTLIKLLTRLYEPDHGAIQVNGTDLRDLDVDAWRREVSVVFQDYVRFELSVADNIAFGAVHARRDLEALRRVAAKVGLLDLIEGLPAGWETPLNRAYDDGVDLSGGQWQRVAIARALYALEAGARLLILDEPTAALDIEAEVRFFEQFMELTRGATSVLISHRLSSVRRADHIVVLDDGRVREQASHDDLIAADGEYARLFRLQAERFEAPAEAGGDR